MASCKPDKAAILNEVVKTVSGNFWLLLLVIGEDVRRSYVWTAEAILCCRWACSSLLRLLVTARPPIAQRHFYWASRRSDKMRKISCTGGGLPKNNDNVGTMTNAARWATTRLIDRVLKQIIAVLEVNQWLVWILSVLGPTTTWRSGGFRNRLNFIMVSLLCRGCYIKGGFNESRGWQSCQAGPGISI